MAILNGIEILQALAVEKQIVGAPHSGNAVAWEAQELIQRNTYIQQRQWNRQAVNDRDGQPNSEGVVLPSTQLTRVQFGLVGDAALVVLYAGAVRF